MIERPLPAKARTKVCQIGSRGIPGRRGGVERVIEAVAPRLARAGYEVSVYCDGREDEIGSSWEGVRLLPVRSVKSKYFDTILRSGIATVRATFGRDEIVHIHGSGSAPLALIPRLFGKKTVVTVHGMDWQRRKWNIFGRLALRFGEWAAIKFPHQTIVVGPDLKTWLDERYRTNVTYIPNGVEARPQRPARAIRQLGLSERNYVLFLARLVPEKQVHLLIEAWMGLAKTNGMQLVIAGPAWHSADYAEGLKRQAEPDQSIQFLGEVDEEQLEELYANCFAYVLPSEVEGMSLSLLDALAFGACIICSDIPPNLEVIANTGLSFKSLDVVDLRARLTEIIDNPEKAAELRSLAQARADSEYSWDEVARKWAALYTSLTSAKTRIKAVDDAMAERA